MYRLRELERGDVAQINRWRNDASLIECLGAPFRYINAEVDQKWYDAYMNSRSNTVRCAIVDDENEIIGLISLVNIDHVNRSAVMHIMIGDIDNRSKGIGSFAVKSILEHAFNNLNLQRIELNVLENNLAAIGLYQKVGFVQEGIKRHSNYKNGKYCNMIMMGLLKDEWKK